MKSKLNSTEESKKVVYNLRLYTICYNIVKITLIHRVILTPKRRVKSTPHSNGVILTQCFGVENIHVVEWLKITMIGYQKYIYWHINMH